MKEDNTFTLTKMKTRMTVNEKLFEFYSKNNLGKDGGVNKNWNKFNIGKLFFPFPNLNKKGYLLHDVNHLLCEYGIEWYDEFEIAAWELGSGGRKGFGLSWLYPIIGSIVGLILIPRRTIKAYKLGLKRTNAHILSRDNKVLEMEFEEIYKLSYKV